MRRRVTSSPTHKFKREGSCRVKTDVQAWVRSRSRKYYTASQEVLFMLMRAAELQTKGRPDILYKKNISTCSRNLQMFNNALTIFLSNYNTSGGLGV